MTRRNLLLYLLQQAGERGLTTAELLQGGVGSRYSARLMELRRQGYVIAAQRIREGSWRYELISEPEGKESYGTGSGGVPTTEPIASPDALFDSPKTSKTRSAVTGEWIPDEAA